MTDRLPREGARWGGGPVPLVQAPSPHPDLPSQEEINRNALVERFGPDSVEKSIQLFYRLKYSYPDAPILVGGDTKFAKGLLEAINRHVRDAAYFGESLTVPSMLEALIPVIERDAFRNNLHGWDGVQFNYGRKYKKVHDLWRSQMKSSSATKKSTTTISSIIFVISFVIILAISKFSKIDFANVDKMRGVAVFQLNNKTWWSGDIVVWIENESGGELCATLINAPRFSSIRIRMPCSAAVAKYTIYADWAVNRPKLVRNALRVNS